MDATHDDEDQDGAGPLPADAAPGADRALAGSGAEAGGAAIDAAFAKALRKAERRAERTAARIIARAAAKAERRAEKAARRAARAAARAADRALREDERSVRRARIAAALGAAAPAVRGEAAPAAAPAPSTDPASAGMPPAAVETPPFFDAPTPALPAGRSPGEILDELAALVRRTSEPAAARIVARVDALVVRDAATASGLTRPPRTGRLPVAASPGAPPPSRPATAPAAAPSIGAAPPPLAPVVAAVPPTAVPRVPPPSTASPPFADRAGARVVVAVIDVGSTSTHLLVARAGAHAVEPLRDESVFLGLGDRAATRGLLGAEHRERLLAALAGYAATACDLGAEELVVLGAQPLRAAADAGRVVAGAASLGLPLHVLDHDEEALLTLLGVTLGHRPRGDLVVADVGGGSTDLVLVAPGGAVRTAGIPVGAARLTREIVRSDPPSAAELAALRELARSAVTAAPAMRPAELVAVGGTASNLRKLLPEAVEDGRLDRWRLTTALAVLAAAPSGDAAARFAIRPERARLLPAGAAIVAALLEHCGIDALVVAEQGMREGAALALAVAGPAWRDRLPQLARGLVPGADVPGIGGAQPRPA